MTENGDPLENAIAERVNGILKEDYLPFRWLSKLLLSELDHGCLFPKNSGSAPV